MLILTAMCMTAMLCIAGLAVDVGHVRALRAQYQAVADSSALYATYLIRQPGADVETVAAEVRAFVAQNLHLSGGTADATWANCDDPRPLPTRAAHDVAIGNRCISFSLGASSSARIRLPVLQVRPVIGLGVISMPVTAVAGADGTGSAACDAFQVGGCTATTTTTRPTTSTTIRPASTTTSTTIPPGPTTTRPAPTTTRPPVPTTTRPTVPTTRPAPTTTRPPVPTTIDIGF